MKSSTTDAAFKKFVQDWSENNTACCVNKHIWTSAIKI